MTTPDPRGYRGPEACGLAGITYRQLDYWARTGLAEPSIRAAHGSGTQRLYSRHDVIKLAAIAELLNAGISLQGIRHVIDHADWQGDDHVTAATTGYVAVVLNLTKLRDRIPEPTEPGQAEPGQAETTLHAVR